MIDAEKNTGLLFHKNLRYFCRILSSLMVGIYFKNSDLLFNQWANLETNLEGGNISTEFFNLTAIHSFSLLEKGECSPEDQLSLISARLKICKTFPVPGIVPDLFLRLAPDLLKRFKARS